MLPHRDGYELSDEIRKRYQKLPVIFLTAKTQTADVIKGFSSGGTDYIRKPFSMEELVARIKNQLQLIDRQQDLQEQPEINLGSFRFSPKKLELYTTSATIKLSNREAEILKLLCEYANRPIERRTLLLRVWGDDSFFSFPES
jgi:DNA-binding response OmpR family regulator